MKDSERTKDNKLPHYCIALHLFQQSQSMPEAANSFTEISNEALPIRLHYGLYITLHALLEPILLEAQMVILTR
jgi:hypothetical protein